MKFFKIILILSLFVSLFSLPAVAQTDTTVLNRIMTKSAKLYTNYPVEKVYLHFDKPYYAVGDTIWFKAYLTVYQHEPSPLSKIINVLVLGPRDSLVQSLKLQVKNGVAWSDIALSQYVYKKGNYRVVAFTNYMNNDDPAYFFNKNITIGDAINNPVSTQISLKNSFSNKTPKITAGIYFKDDNGNPYAGKKINWTIQRDYEDVGKGKVETDKNGYAVISFINTKNIPMDSATMVTVLDNGYRKQITSTFPLKSVSKPNDFQFFAEGGSMIVGMKSKIAFKAVSPNGLGIGVRGTITDNTNKVIAEFSSTHLGMGSFIMTPEEGKTYTANVTFADGTTASPDFSKIETNSINLSVDNSDADVLKLKLQSDAAFLQANQGHTFFILAKASGVICYGAKTVFQNQVYSSVIPKNKFPTGIVQITLFTEDGDPISERIAFIQHNDQLNLAVSTDHPTYTARQKVKLNLVAKNGTQPAEGNFSLTVVDESKVPFDDNSETTILTNLLLTSDIKGYIEKPNYYFNHPDEKTAAELDVLLQTQGYRRFSYDHILSDKYPAINFLAEQGINITGTLRASNGIAINKGNINLSIHDRNYTSNTVTNEDGRFRFSNLVFTDSTEVKLSARNNIKASDLVLTADGDAYQKISTNNSTPDEIMNIDSVLSPYIKNSKARFANTHVLKEVVIKDTRIRPTITHKDYSALSSLGMLADHVINADALDGCNDVLECLKVLAMGMTYDQGNFYVLRDYNQGKKIPAAIYVRGIPVDVNFLSTLNPKEIESVEVFTKDELGLVNSANGTNGVLVVNMRKIETTKISLAQLRDLIPPKNEVTFTPKGYAPFRTFYMPRYDRPRETQSNAVDTRSTIYWSPNVITDKTTGAASVEFFNADTKGSYRAIIEGLDKDGNLGRQVFKYTVK